MCEKLFTHNTRTITVLLFVYVFAFKGKIVFYLQVFTERFDEVKKILYHYQTTTFKGVLIFKSRGKTMELPDCIKWIV